MGANSAIQWTDHTFNPWIGCTKVDELCTNCYAESEDKRRGWTEGGWGKGKPRHRTCAATWNAPRKWNRQTLWCDWCKEWREPGDHQGDLVCPKCLSHAAEMRRPRVFSASLADWLDDDQVPIEWLADFLQLIHETPSLDWLLLTKRPENFFPRISAALDVLVRQNEAAYAWAALWRHRKQPPANVWIGTSAGTQKGADLRISDLLKIPAKVRFLSCEPLLEAIDVQRSCTLRCPNRSCFPNEYGPERLVIQSDEGGMAVECVCSRLNGIHWVICGGESGAHARPMHPEWARSLRVQCEAASVPFFFKQWGEWEQLTHAGGWDDEYEREFPKAVVWEKGNWVLCKDADFSTLLEEDEFAPVMHRIGKHHAGRLLYGVEHSAFPA